MWLLKRSNFFKYPLQSLLLFLWLHQILSKAQISWCLTAAGVVVSYLKVESLWLFKSWHVKLIPPFEFKVHRLLKSFANQKSTRKILLFHSSTLFQLISNASPPSLKWYKRRKAASEALVESRSGSKHLLNPLGMFVWGNKRDFLIPWELKSPLKGENIHIVQ